MVYRWLAGTAVVLAAGCGRVGFDTLNDGGDGGGTDGQGGNVTGLGPITLPSGGTVLALAVAPDNSARYALTNGGPYRSTNGTWTPCGAQEGSAISVDPSGAIYITDYDDFYESTDNCATWQRTNVPCYPTMAGIANGKIYALCNGTGGGLVVRTAGTWAVVHTAFDADQLDSFAASTDGQLLLIGSDLDGAIRSTTAGASWTMASTGLTTDSVAGLAIASDKTHVYAMEASVEGGSSDISCSVNGGANWTSCYGNGGSSIAVDPANPLHVIAAPYDNLVVTSDGFATYTNDVRNGAMDKAGVNAITYTPAGSLLVATDRGIYEADDASLEWFTSEQGISSWSIDTIVIAGANVYIGSDAGMLASLDGAPYTISTVGMTDNTQMGALVAVASPDVVIAGSRDLRLSTDHGQTWSTLDELDGDDGYYISSMALIGTRVFAGSQQRVLYADPPWTTWTPTIIGGSGQAVFALLVRDGVMWAGAEGGLFKSTDNGVSFQFISAISDPVLSLGLTPDNRLLVGTTDNVWISDATASSWTATTIDEGNIYGLAGYGTAIVAATANGLRVTHDSGTTWTTVAGFDDEGPTAVTFEANGDLLVGTFGYGVTRIATP